MSTISQKSFAAGEIAPALYARCDTSKYVYGLRTCRNFMVLKHGGVSNRPGTEFMCEVKDSTRTVRLIPYILDGVTAYVIELGHLYFRVIQDGVPFRLAAKTITGITKANPAVVTSTAHGYSNGDQIYITGVQGMTQVNDRTYKVANVAANTFELKDLDGTNINSSSYTTYSSAGSASKIYEVTTTYDEADIAEIRYVQNGNTLTLVHPDYVPKTLTFSGTVGSIDDIPFGASVVPPTALSNNGPAGTATVWKVSSISELNGEESPPSGPTGTSATPSSGGPITVSWTDAADVSQYNVYQELNGVGGLVGVSGGGSFVDRGYTPDFGSTPPIQRTIFGTYYPTAVAYHQQRLILSNLLDDLEQIGASRSGSPYSFPVHIPVQDDDSVLFKVSGQNSGKIMHLMALGKLIVFTSSGEWAIEGDQAGIITPSDINPKQYSSYGSSRVRPIIVGGSALFVQSRGSVIRDLAYDFSADGYKGNDLTIFSGHLFDGYTVTDWAYQQVPNSIIWAVRDDGQLLGLTYVKEQDILAWHRHDFQDAEVENVCAVPEGAEDAVYLVVKRTINGVERRYIERMHTRTIVDVIDSVFIDSSFTYDGRNDGAATMTLSGGTTWDYDETLTLTASASTFSSGFVGLQIHLTGADGELIRFTITGYTNATVVTGRANREVPASLRSTATLEWATALAVITGLWHLEGKQVAVFADRFVVANPNNEAYTVRTVANGSVSLDKHYSVVHIGLPYTSDLETLDIDTAQGETLADKHKLITGVTLQVEKARGLWVGPKPPTDDTTDPLEDLVELKLRDAEAYDDAVDMATGRVRLNILSEWNAGGRVFVRQIDPIPASILAIMPSGRVPFK